MGCVALPGPSSVVALLIPVGCVALPDPSSVVALFIPVGCVVLPDPSSVVVSVGKESYVADADDDE